MKNKYSRKITAALFITIIQIIIFVIYIISLVKLTNRVGIMTVIFTVILALGIIMSAGFTIKWAIRSKKR